MGLIVCSPGGRNSTVKAVNRTGSPARNIGQNKPRVEANVCANQFQVLRELLGDYPSSDGKSIRGDSVVPESALEGEVGDHVQRFPSSTKFDCIVYSRRGEKGKGKVVNDFRACSSGLLGCGGGDAGVEVPLGQEQGGELNGLVTSHC